MPTYRNTRRNDDRRDRNYNGRYDNETKFRRRENNERAFTSRATRRNLYDNFNKPNDYENLMQTILERVKQQLTENNTVTGLQQPTNVQPDNRQPRTHLQGANNVQPTGNVTQPSLNPEFHTLWKTLFKVTQIRHHIDNWSRLPKSIARDLTYLGKNIRPPDAVDDLSSDIGNILTNAGEQIRQRVHTHLLNRLDVNRSLLKSILPLDKERAIEVAHRNLTKRLKCKEDDVRRTLEEEARSVGLNLPVRHQLPPMTTPSVKRARTEATPTATPTDRSSNAQPVERPAIENPIMEIEPTTNVTVHVSQPEEITILPNTETIIIADECLMYAKDTEVDPSLQIEILPGAEIAVLADVILDLPQNLPQEIILFGGVKHLHTGTYQPHTDSAMLSIRQRISAGAKIGCLGLCTAEDLTPKEAENLQLLNSQLKRVFRENCVGTGSSTKKMSEDKRHYDPTEIPNILYILRFFRDYKDSED